MEKEKEIARRKRGREWRERLVRQFVVYFVQTPDSTSRNRFIISNTNVPQSPCIQSCVDLSFEIIMISQA